MTDIIDDLTWRGLIAVSTDLDELRRSLDAGQVTLYGGFDPSATTSRGFSTRSADLPLGSPISPVAPPTRPTGRCPAS